MALRGFLVASEGLVGGLLITLLSPAVFDRVLRSAGVGQTTLLSCSPPTDSWRKYLVPQLSNFEAACTLSRVAGPPGTNGSEELRHNIFFQNAYDHWTAAIKGIPQQPLRQKSAPLTPTQPAYLLIRRWARGRRWPRSAGRLCTSAPTP